MTTPLLEPTALTPGRATMARVADLKSNPLNPRTEVDEASIRELAESIRTHGILQRLLVTPDGYVLAGHRRLAAAVLIGLDEVPVDVRELTDGERQQIEIALVENLQREGLSPLDEARAYERLLEEGGLTRSEISRRLGVIPSQITERLKILSFDEEIRGMFHRGELPLTATKALEGIEDLGVLRRVASALARRAVPVSGAKEYARRLDEARKAPTEEEARAADRARAREAKRHARQMVDKPPEREEAAALLAEHPKKYVSFEALERAMRLTCRECGIGNDLVCRQCPVPRLIKSAVWEASNVRRRA